MTLTKNSTNYGIEDKLGEVNVRGTVALNEDNSINISISTDNGGYASFSRSPEGFINFNSSFNEANDLIDYTQSLIADIRQELGK
jgi:hypothetical protein